MAGDPIDGMTWSKGHSQFKVWIGVQSGWEFDPQPCGMVREFGVHTEAAMGQRQVTAEAFVPTGGLALYGLLGLRFDPLANGRLRVEVCTGLKRPGLPDALAGPWESVRVGLSDEFCEPVFQTICETIASAEALPAGKLCMSAAGVGEVGTCRMIMSRLVGATWTLLCDPTAGEDRIVEIVESEVLSRRSA